MNPITNSTLNTLIAELGTECAQVQALINQLQLPSLTANHQAEIRFSSASCCCSFTHSL